MLFMGGTSSRSLIDGVVDDALRRKILPTSSSVRTTSTPLFFEVREELKKVGQRDLVDASRSSSAADAGAALRGDVLEVRVAPVSGPGRSHRR